MVLQWDQAALQAIRDTRPLPTVAARALAVAHTAIYDAWAAYDPVAVGTRLGGSLRRPAAEQTIANKSMAIGYAADYADSCIPACYQPANTPDAISDPSRWQPLRLPNGTVQTFTTPHWRNVIPRLR